MAADKTFEKLFARRERARVAGAATRDVKTPPDATPAARTPIGWHTSIGVGGKAHFYVVEGKPACGDRKGIWPGMCLGELFTRPTRPTTDEDHVCHYCALNYPRACGCWSCEAKRRGAHRP